MIELISRSEWGAAPPKNAPTPVDWYGGGPLWVHYSDGPPPGDSVVEEMKTVRAIQSFHQNTRGWNDIGYAYLIAPSGRIYEGRGWEVLGAHCPGHNDEPSVCLMWKSTTILPPKVALDAVLRIKSYVQAGKLMGHREGTSTNCPGAVIFSWIVANRYSTLHVAKYEPPWQVFDGDTQIGAGRLVNPFLVMRISKALRAKGHLPPYQATVDGKPIANGKFWPPGDYTRAISGKLRVGREVAIENTVFIRPKGLP